MGKSSPLPTTSQAHTVKRLLHEFFAAVDKTKAKGIKSSNMYDCFYILLTATEESQRKQGLNAAMMKTVMERACKANKPIWLEATTMYSRRQYERLGYEVIGEITVGKGKVNKEGFNEKGGEGVTVTGMVWWPEGKGKEVAREGNGVERQGE